MPSALKMNDDRRSATSFMERGEPLAGLDQPVLNKLLPLSVLASARYKSACGPCKYCLSSYQFTSVEPRLAFTHRASSVLRIRTPLLRPRLLRRRPQMRGNVGGEFGDGEFDQIRV